MGIPWGHGTTCPLAAVQALLTTAMGERLCARNVARVVQSTARRAGLDAGRYGGHSLRSGHATTAAAAGAEERDIARQTGHRSTALPRRSIGSGHLFRANTGALLCL